MPVELVISPEAELDITEAYVWYEGRRAGPYSVFCEASAQVAFMANFGISGHPGVSGQKRAHTASNFE
jgi:hypothetical protein